MILVDTGAWYADFIPDDENHLAARAFVETSQGEQFVTTDYLVVETLNLLIVRGYADRAREGAIEFFEGKIATIEWVTRKDVERAREVFERFSDKRWSFTDCVSYAVIERLRIKKAFAFDQHFRQFGIVEVVP